MEASVSFFLFSSHPYPPPPNANLSGLALLRLGAPREIDFFYPFFLLSLDSFSLGEKSFLRKKRPLPRRKPLFRSELAPSSRYPLPPLLRGVLKF